MAESYKDITGPLIFTATLNAKPSKAEELARYLRKEKAQSDNEPGSLRYDAVRFGNTFAVWETYASHEAIELHIKNLPEGYKEFLAVCLVEPPTTAFYPADSLLPASSGEEVAT